MKKWVIGITLVILIIITSFGFGYYALAQEGRACTTNFRGVANMRSFPGLVFNAVGTIPANTCTVMLDAALDTEPDDNIDSWIKVRYNGVEGWVANTLMLVEVYALPTPTNTPTIVPTASPRPSLTPFPTPTQEVGNLPNLTYSRTIDNIEFSITINFRDRNN